MAKLLKTCILLPFLIALAYSPLASAQDGQLLSGVLDEADVSDAKGSGNNNGRGQQNGNQNGRTSKTEKELIKEVKKEQREIEKLARNELRNRADKGERLAQVVLANDFAEEAQMLGFAPVAANAALGDALQYYNLAAQRGYPGALSLDTSGVSTFPIRVVRNR